MERGIAQKPDDLDISWKATDPVGSARESRRFLLTAMMVFAAEELGAYALQILKWRGVDLEETRAERLRALGSVDPAYLGAGAVLTSQWRNRITHRHSNAHISSTERRRLYEAADEISKKYKNLEVGKLLSDFESGRPTLKDVTVLMAMCTAFVRQVDASVSPPADSEAVRRWLKALGLLEVVVRREREAANGGSPDPRAKSSQILRTAAPTIADAYYTYGTAQSPLVAVGVRRDDEPPPLKRQRWADELSGRPEARDDAVDDARI